MAVPALVMAASALTLLLGVEGVELAGKSMLRQMWGQGLEGLQGQGRSRCLRARYQLLAAGMRTLRERKGQGLEGWQGLRRSRQVRACYLMAAGRSTLKERKGLGVEKLRG